MKTDPNEACSNQKQLLLWALLHDGVAHPLMALTGYSKWSRAFHDYTSLRAWPVRKKKPSVFVAEPSDEAVLNLVREYFRTNGRACVIEGRPTSDGYEYRLSAVYTAKQGVV